MQAAWGQATRLVRRTVLGLAWLAGFSAPLVAAEDDAWRAVLPEATAIGEPEGRPPATPAYRNGSLIGYVASTKQAIDAKGYAGGTLDILLGIDLDARLVGARLIEQHEPILKTGVRPEDLEAFVKHFAGLDLNETHRVVRDEGGPHDIDAVSGATISSVVIGDVILRTARAIARSRGLFGETTGAINIEDDEPAGWQDLLDEGSIETIGVTVREAVDAVDVLGSPLYPPGAAPPGDAPFIDVYAGLATPARVGKSLLGDKLYNRLINETEVGGHLLFIAASGAYSFKGTNYVRGGAFDRFRLLQGPDAIIFEKDDHVSIEALAFDQPPDLRELAIFKISPEDGFRATEPWTFELLVTPIGKKDGPVASFMLPYELPDRFFSTSVVPEASSTPLWQTVWQARSIDIAILVLALVLLTGILVFQDMIAARPRLYRRLRLGFLVFVLVWLGWYASAQLSVLNVLTFSQALLTGFDWTFFLLEPLIFILWAYVAVALLFWGRGVFCGWLCPFGALQELTHAIAKRLRVPELRVPFALHERLWPIKFVIFLGLFALSLGPMAWALDLAEIEPFKTAVVLRFDRTWPYLAYAVALLIAGLFIERFFCRYLCPLGAAFAIPSRLRQFEWLKRRWQCGRQCQICAVGCPVQAIHPEGQINPSECIHCLACQVNYLDDHTCPALIERRKRRERRATAIAKSAGMSDLSDG